MEEKGGGGGEKKEAEKQEGQSGRGGKMERERIEEEILDIQAGLVRGVIIFLVSCIMPE